MTQDSPWVAFSNNDTPIAKEERDVFAALEMNYNVDAALDSSNGYKALFREWNEKVACRYREFMEGEDVVLIYHKSVTQLQVWGRRM